MTLGLYRNRKFKNVMVACTNFLKTFFVNQPASTTEFSERKSCQHASTTQS